MAWPDVPQAGRTALGGRWHRLVIRPAMFPWPYDHHYPEILYPACGSGVLYFKKGEQVVEIHCDHTVVNCKKCLKGLRA